MVKASNGFGFVDEACALAVIAEDDAEDEDSIDVNVDDQLSQAKSETAELAAVAEMEILELQELLDKLKIGSATRQDKDRIASLSRKVSATKTSIQASQTRQNALKTKSDTRKLIKAVKETRVKSVVKAVRDAEGVDLAFVVDSTGSMGPHIAAVKNSIRGIAADIKQTNQDLKLRLALIAYRDIDVNPGRVEVFDFVSNIDAFHRSLDSIKAYGSADACEDMAIGIQEANRLAWSQSTRVVFVIADCPCHGRLFHSQELSDSYPRGTPRIDILRELRHLKKKSSDGTMSIYFGRITHYTDRMLQAFNAQGIPIESLPFMDAKAATSSIKVSVRRSVSLTLSLSGSTLTTLSSLQAGATGNARLKKYSVVSRRPQMREWKPSTSVRVYRNVQVKSMNDLRGPLGFGMLKFDTSRTDKTKELTMWLRRSKAPFAEGEIRIAFHGHLADKEENLSRAESAMVVKSFKYVGKGLNDRRQYLKQMEVSTIAHFMAQEYNKSPFRPSHCALVNVLQVCVVEEETDAHEFEGNRRFCAEPYLPEEGGAFTKYSNNTGYWNLDVLDETLLRFTEFTYRATSGYLMVTDLQGVKKDDSFVLTDPIILCKDIIRFGHTNLGEKFMDKCVNATRALMKENGWHCDSYH